MKELHEQYPFYGWNRNAGYPTREHREAIRAHGITPYHRKHSIFLATVSWNLNSDQPQITSHVWNSINSEDS